MKSLEQSLKQTNGGKKPAARTAKQTQDLPIPNYDELSVQEVLEQLEELSSKDLRKIRTYEEKHKKRKSLITRLKQTA
jgi:uncharacterized protein (DUF433 family)